MDSHEVGAAMTAVRNCWAMYGQSMSDLQVESWIELLEPYSLAQIKQGIADHMADGEGGRFKPMPAHIIAMINKRLPQPMTAEEAWGLALDQLDESITVRTSTWIDYAMNACSSILANNDKYGARLCFEAAYKRISLSGTPNAIRISLGHDITQRDQVVREALANKEISEAQARVMLPPPEVMPNNVARIEGKAGKVIDQSAMLKTLRQTINQMTANAENKPAEKRAEFEAIRERELQAIAAKLKLKKEA